MRSCLRHCHLLHYANAMINDSEMSNTLPHLLPCIVNKGQYGLTPMCCNMPFSLLVTHGKAQSSLTIARMRSSLSVIAARTAAAHRCVMAIHAKYHCRFWYCVCHFCQQKLLGWWQASLQSKILLQCKHLRSCNQCCPVAVLLRLPLHFLLTCFSQCLLGLLRC